MKDLGIALGNLKLSLCKEIDVGGLIARSEIAHKWKSPWRALLLREAVAWRIQDLLEQSYKLHELNAVLGARILLRSAFETLAILIYLNQSMRNVVAENSNFHEFSERTTKLLLGSRDKSTSYDSVNILTVLHKADQRYPGLEEWYGALSESAHPNHEGMILGYSKNDTPNFTTHFENRWADGYGLRHPNAIVSCLKIFEHEYNDEWTDAFEELERWIELNDDKLEASKPSTTKSISS